MSILYNMDILQKILVRSIKIYLSNLVPHMSVITHSYTPTFTIICFLILHINELTSLHIFGHVSQDDETVKIVILLCSSSKALALQ